MMGVAFVPRYVRPSIVVFDSKNQILLVQYCEDNSWGIPGGCMEVGESVEESARRELLEETGLTSLEMKLETIVVWRDILNVVYRTNKYSGDLRSDGVETNDVRFFSLGALPENLNPFIRQSLEQFGYK